MWKVLLLLCFNAFIKSSGQAQKPENLLNNWSARSPIEKIYLHLDRDNYIAGETIWFKAYLSSDWQPDTISTTLYVELVNEKLSVVQRKTLPVFLAAAFGQIELPDSLSSGNYVLRAYTTTMLNQDASFIYKKSVFVFGSKENRPDTPIQKMKLEFFPEGGNLINGFNSSVAFKAAYENGMPANVKGIIKTGDGKKVTTFSSIHDGMGLFEISPVAGETYFAVIDSTEVNEKFQLPDAVSKGVVFSVIPHPQGNYFEIKQKPDDPVFTAAYMIGQMQHHVVFKQEFISNTPTLALEGVINTQKLNSGILQVTVFNKTGMPLAERLCFVNNREYQLPVEIKADTIDFNSRTKNKFRIVMKDTVMANISVAVTDADYELKSEREENIFSSFLLTSDLQGYVHKPAYYFSSTDDSVKNAADLLMMTNGWRRFKWTELAKQSFPLYKDNSYITISGRASLRGVKKSFAEKDLLLIATSLNKKRISHIMQTDQDGKFRVDSLVFFDVNRLLFSDVRGKKSQYIDVTLNSDSLNCYFSLSSFPKYPSLFTEVSSSVQSKWKMDYDAILKANGVMLEGVTVKVRKKTPLEMVDERYTTGMFSGDATRTIDLVNDDIAGNYLNVFDYLQARVNGLQILQEGLDYNIYYRQGPSVSSYGNIPMTIYLDEFETDASVVATIPGNQIALVKVYNTFAGGWGNAPGGVLAIYTKKGNDYMGVKNFANYGAYNGYSVVKEFYAPDYKKENGNGKNDNRITLDWRPAIFINNVNPAIPVSFYNNDRSKRFKVIVEGMANDGKLIMAEKIIDRSTH
ncbi:MAG: hypothetical protein HZB42_01155 [Sphingobacteriales bacterium]|nr:hypothetical protein [Sphingobacteriales bacterium]